MNHASDKFVIYFRKSENKFQNYQPQKYLQMLILFLYFLLLRYRYEKVAAVLSTIIFK